MTRADLESGLDALIGLTELPYWDMCPTDTIVPPLHCELGTVKYQLWDHLVSYLLLIDCRTEEEDELRTKIDKLNEDVVAKLTDIGLAGANHAVWWDEQKPILSEYRRKRNNVARKLKTALASKQKNA